MLHFDIEIPVKNHMKEEFSEEYPGITQQIAFPQSTLCQRAKVRFDEPRIGRVNAVP